MEMNVEMKFARLENGFRCYYQHWLPENPRALLVMVHGMGDHIGRYNEFVSFLSSRGYACALYDQRGFGQSDGRRGHVRSFKIWLDDLENFIAFTEDRIGGAFPLYLVGGSLGGLVCFNYLITTKRRIAGLISAAAAIIPAVKVGKIEHRVAKILGLVMPVITVDNRLDYDDLTRDADEKEALIKDRMFSRRISIGTALEIEKRLSLVMTLPMRIRVPVLMLTGSEDAICLSAGSRKFASLLSSPDKKLVVYEGMCHDILHDIGRKRVMNDIAIWLDERTGGDV
jgi:lysophospholipase